MGFWANISILLLLVTILFVIVGIIFLFMKNGKAKKVFKISVITFSGFIVTLILSSENGFWFDTFLLAFLTTIVLIVIGIFFLFVKNEKFKKVFKASGVAFSVFIISLILTLAFEDNNGNQIASTSSQNEDSNQDLEAKKAEEEAKVEAEAKKAEEKAKVEAEAKKAEEKAKAEVEAEAKKIFVSEPSTSTTTTTSNSEIYQWMKSKYDEITNYGEYYVPEVHDFKVAQLASEKFGISPEKAGGIYVEMEMGGY